MPKFKPKAIKTVPEKSALTKKGSVRLPLGRKPWTPEQKQAAYALLIEGKRVGLPIKDLCAAAHVSEGWFYTQVRVGTEAINSGNEDIPEAKFLRDIESAEAQRIQDSLTLIRTAAWGGHKSEETTETVEPDGDTTFVKKVKEASPQWQAAAWLLERTRPEEFALKTRTEHTGEPVSGNITNNVTVVGFTPEEARIAAAAIVRSRRLAQEAELITLPMGTTALPEKNGRR
jgi:transposase-like protein